MNHVNKRDSTQGRPLENLGGIVTFENNRYDFVPVKIGILGMEIVRNPKTYGKT
jgi:hypothetical protein